jgi:hypothetical protein
LQTSKAATNRQDALEAGIADIKNDKKISNVQKDTEIKALQAKSLADATLVQLLGAEILKIV